MHVHLNTSTHFLGGISLTAQTVDLSQAGHARFDLVAIAITADTRSVVFIVNECMWPRADQRHLAEQYVDQLGPFIDASFAQKPPDSGSPCIVPARLLNVVTVFCDRHGAKLEHDDLALVAAMSTLAEEHRSGAVEFYGHRDRQKQR